MKKVILIWITQHLYHSTEKNIEFRLGYHWTYLNGSTLTLRIQPSQNIPGIDIGKSISVHYRLIKV